MGPQTPGGIESHLEATRLATIAWLEYEDKLADPSLADLGEFAAEDETPRQPEALTILREAKRFGVPVLQGDMDTWPHISRLEFNTVLDAEDEHLRIKARNLKLRAEHAAKNAKTPTA